MASSSLASESACLGEQVNHLAFSPFKNPRTSPVLPSKKNTNNRGRHHPTPSPPSSSAAPTRLLGKSEITHAMAHPRRSQCLLDRSDAHLPRPSSSFYVPPTRILHVTYSEPSFHHSSNDPITSSSLQNQSLIINPNWHHQLQNHPSSILTRIISCRITHHQ